MWSVPEGVVLVLLRHGQTIRNLRVAKAHAQKRGSDFPIRFPDEEDRLTMNGRVESFLCAKHLKKKLGSLDLIAYSTSPRTEETADFIIREINPLASLYMIPELSEKFRWAPEGFWRVTPSSTNEADFEVCRFLVDLVQDFVKNERVDNNPDVRGRLNDVMGEYAQLLFKWRMEQEKNRKTLQNYSKFGEDFIDLLLRAIKVLLKIWGRIERGARKIVVVGHAKMLIMLRAVLENLSIEELDKLYSAEGPPFFCNVGMTFYGEHKGKLRREGPVVAPPDGLEPDGRRLRITMGRKEYEEILTQIIDFQKPARRYGPPRRGNGVPSNLADMLKRAKAKASPPILSFQRRNRASGPRR